MENFDKLNEKLEKLKLERKNNEISLQEFCNSLIDILEEMRNYLVSGDSNQVKKNIPFLLTVIQSQLKEAIKNNGR